MNADRIDGQTTSGTRAILAENIPLQTPYIVQIFPAYSCNFKCSYCIHSVEPLKRGFIANEKLMDFDLYKKCIDELGKFPQKIKMLRFGATGEPLIHPQISEMVKYASEKNIANSIEIVTNASLLTKKLTDNLVNSNLNWLRVSIQGLSSKKYKEMSGVEINFENLVENLKYFYKTKKGTKVYIKIIDVALERGEEEKFFKIFGDICDKIAVEHLLPAVDSIDYTKLTDKEFNLTQNGNKVTNSQICPQPFYMMQINPDGNVVPCCAMETAYVAGNCKEEKLPEIWNGNKYRNFQLQMLNKEKDKNKICAVCQSYKYGMFQEDVLDDKAEQLKNKFKIGELI